MDVDRWGADAVYSGTQKCLSCVPGLSPVTFSPRAQDVIKNRSRPVQSWFLDMDLVMGYWGENRQRAYHHTAPINGLYALHEALVILYEEGLENAWARHLRHHEALAAGVEALGREFVVESPYRLPQLNCVAFKDGINDGAVRKQLLADYQLEIGAGLGPLAGKVWRIGLMGYAANQKNVLLCLGALETVLSENGVALEAGHAVAAAQKIYSAG